MGVIKMLQLCISEIKSDVLLKLSNEGENDHYLEYLINEIEKQDYLKEIDEKRTNKFLKELNVSLNQLMNLDFPSELSSTIDVTLSWETFHENYDYLFACQTALLDYFLLYYANELISFLESKKTTIVGDSKKPEKEVEFESLDVYSQLLYLFNELEKIKIDIFREARHCGSAEAYNKIELKYEEDIDIIKGQINRIIDDLYSQSKKDNIYYFDCPSEVYKNHFSNRMSNYFKEVPEANELDFLKSEIKYFSNPLKNRVLKKHYNYCEFIGNTDKYKIILRRKLEFLSPKLKKYNYKITYKEDAWFEDPVYGKDVLGTEIKIVKDETLNYNLENQGNTQKKESNNFTSTSFKFEKNKTADDFHKMHSNAPFFKEPLSKNPNFLKELFEFLSDENRPVKTTYEIFNKKLNLYLINGFSLFYMRFSSPESVVLYPATSKMQYLEELKKRKADLSGMHNKQTLRDEIKHTYSLRDVYKKKFQEFFSYDENLKNNASSYSYILINAVERLLNSASIYFEELTPDQILGLNDNKLNIVKSEIESNFKAYHNLIKFISLNHTPYREHQAVEFISTTIQFINKRNFERTYLYDILEKESNKISNEKVYEKIVQKNKLLETHQFFINGKPSNEKLETDKREDDENLNQYRSNIFLNQNAQKWFVHTIQEMNAVNNKNIAKRGFQAVCDALYSNKTCEKIIFKYGLTKTNYIIFLNSEFQANIKSKDKLSSGLSHESKVKELIELYETEWLPNKPE
ncbi:hypothetical protein [Corallibacter sp.]|uniref:hypothetical protein n=1 Tax=Corallibacter sp. TaxID=2038084 RepID=UPI003AB1A040